MQKDYIVENKHFKDLNPITLGTQKCESGYEYTCVTNYYLIHYIVSGKGIFISNNKKYNLHQGQCFLIKPYQRGYYKADLKNPWTYIWTGFTGELTKKFDEIESPVFDINSNVFYKLLQFEMFGSAKEFFMASQLFELYCELFGTKQNQNYAEMVKSFIDANYMKKIKISEIAQAMRLDRKYLAKIFKKATDMTMKEYLTQKRMKEAKVLLNNGYTISEIAGFVGYDDQFLFSKAFKNAFGYSPRNTQNLTNK